MKASLSARPGSRKLKKGVQNAPEHESVIRHFWSADQHFWSDERHFKSAELHSFGLWPNSFWVPKRHTIFDFIAKRRVSIRILPIVAYFLSILVSINRDWISKFNTLFYALRAHSFTLKERHPFILSNFSLPFFGILS